jgi:hypothetical protein
VGTRRDRPRILSNEAIAIHNDVGLSSSIFTLNVREAETFLSAITLGRHPFGRSRSEGGK